MQYIVRDDRIRTELQEIINSREDAHQLAEAIRKSAICRGDPETAKHIIVEEV